MIWCSLTRGGCLREIPTIVLWMKKKLFFFCLFDNLWEVWFRLREIPTSNILTGKAEFGYYVYVVAFVRSSNGSTVSLPRCDSVLHSNHSLCRIAEPRVILIKWEHGMTVEQSKKLWICWFWRSFSRRSVHLVWQVWTNYSPSWSSKNCRFDYLSFLLCFVWVVLLFLFCFSGLLRPVVLQ